MKRLEFEMQRLELEQQLEDMRERMAREKKTRQQDVAHEQWVTEQKRNLQAIKIEKVQYWRSRRLPRAALLSRGLSAGFVDWQAVHPICGGISSSFHFTEIDGLIP